MHDGVSEHRFTKQRHEFIKKDAHLDYPSSSFCLRKAIFYLLVSHASIVSSLLGGYALLQFNLSDTLPSFLFFLDDFGDNDSQDAILEFCADVFVGHLDALFESDFALEHADFSALIGDEAVHHGF